MAESEEGGSSSGHAEQPIIIKKIKKGGHGAHGGAWKVAFADFMTAMMAFFLVMWALAQSDDTKAAIEDYFQNPEDFSIFTGQKTVPVSIFDHPASGPTESSTAGGGTTVAVVTPETYQAMQDSVEAAQEVSNTGEELKKLLEEMAESENVSLDMKNILSSIDIEITDEGLRIELLESHDNVFFEIGSARLRPDAVALLRQLAQRIRVLPNFVEVEGHTDSRGYSPGATYTNWELSADRANSARRVLDANGFWAGQITSVSGLADRKLRNPSNPFDFSNRRISIIVKNLTTREFLQK